MNGNKNVILCERGIRTYQQCTRYLLDISCIPILKQKTHLPVIVDPSHAAGRADLVSFYQKYLWSLEPTVLLLRFITNLQRLFATENIALDLDMFKQLVKRLRNQHAI